MSWIKLRTDIFDDPAVENMALDLGTNTRQIVGQLSDIWGWVGRHTTDGQCPNVSPALIDARLQSPGFAEAMIRQGWLEAAEKGVRFPKWDRHNSSSAKARALEAEAKQLRRGMSDKCRTNGAANVGPEKRREEKSINTPIPPKGEQASSTSCQDQDTKAEQSNSTSASETQAHSAQKREGRAAKTKAQELPAEWSASRRQSMQTWLQHKAERGQSYKPTGFVGLIAKLAPLTDAQLAECVSDSICNNWAGLFPERLANGSAAQQKARGGYRHPAPDSYAVPATSAAAPEGWLQAWAELYTFPPPPSWLDVPPANVSEVTQYLKQRAL